MAGNGSASDIKAGGAYLEITAQTQPMEAAFTKAEKTVESFTVKAKTKLTSMLKGFSLATAGWTVGLQTALNAAKKAWEMLSRTVVASLDRMRNGGTDQQKAAVAQLDAAMTGLKRAIYDLIDSAVLNNLDHIVEKIDELTAGFEVFKRTLVNFHAPIERANKVMDYFLRGTNLIYWLWKNPILRWSFDKLVTTPLKNSVPVLKAAADAMETLNSKKLEGWSKDNQAIYELDAINDKVNKSAEDIKRANKIVDDLKSKWGDVGIRVDQVTGKITGLGQAQQKIIDAQNKARINQLVNEAMATQKVQAAMEQDKDVTAEEKEAVRLRLEAIKAEIAALESGKAWWDAANKQMRTVEKQPVGTNTRAGSMIDKYDGLTNSEKEVAKLYDQYYTMLRERIEQLRAAGYDEAEANQIAVNEFSGDWEAVNKKAVKIRNDAADKEYKILQEGGKDLVEDAYSIGQTDLQKEIAALDKRYLDARKQMIDQLVAMGRTEAEAAQMADQYLAEERQAVIALKQEAIDRAAKQEEDILTSGGEGIRKAAETAEMTDLERELYNLEQDYIDVRKEMIRQLVDLGRSEEEAAEMADAYLVEEKAATEKLKQLAIQRDQQAKAEKEAAELKKQMEEAKKQEIEDARAYVEEIEKGLKASEHTYTSSGTFSAFDQLDQYNVATESLNVEKQQLSEQKKLVEKMKEMIDLYEQTDTITAVFA